MLLGANAGDLQQKRPERPVPPQATPVTTTDEKAVVQEFLSLVEKSQQFFSGLRYDLDAVYFNKCNDL